MNQHLWWSFLINPRWFKRIHSLVTSNKEDKFDRIEIACFFIPKYISSNVGRPDRLSSILQYLVYQFKNGDGRPQISSIL